MLCVQASAGLVNRVLTSVNGVMAGNGGKSGARRTRKQLVAFGLALACAGLVASTAITRSATTEATHSERVNPDLKTPPKGTRVNVVADRIVYDARTSIATATGQVIITYGKYQLIATKVVYDRRHDKLSANGNIRLQEPGGNILQADEAELRDRFREGFAKHLLLLLTNEASVTADYARRSDGYLTVYENVTYTRCKRCADPDHPPLWQLRSEEVTHNEREHTIYHKNAALEIGGVPVLALPYLEHPDPTVNRRSGFLVPSGRYADAFGVGVEIPYFWAPADNYDVTFRPIITSKQGPVAQAEFRHALRDGNYSVTGAGVYQLTEDEAPGDRRWRGSLRTEGKFQYSPTWQYGWDGTLVSDDTFLNRYDIDSSDEAVSRVYADGIDGRNYLSVQAIHFRSLIPDVDQNKIPYALPYIQQSYTFDQPVLGGEFGIDSTVYSLTRDKAFTAFSDIDLASRQTRASTSLRWQRQTIFDGGQVIVPFAALRGDLYITENLPGSPTPDTETTARLLPEAGVDMRWPFMTSTAGGRHIVSPVGQLIVSGSERKQDKLSNEDAITLNFDHTSVFLHDRFTGLDRYEGGFRANAGVLYTYLDDDGGFFRASLGESFHIAGDNSFVNGSGLEGTGSDIVVALAWQPSDSLTFNYQARLSEDLSNVNLQQGGVSLTFDRFSGSLNYLDIGAEPFYGRDDSEHQIWSSLSYGWENGFSVFGGARFDLKESKLVEDNIGIGYEDECTALALTYKEDYDSDISDSIERSIFFRVELKTLGSAGVGTQLN